MLNKKGLVSYILILVLVVATSGCVTTDTNRKKGSTDFRPEKTTASYELAGRAWGEDHWNRNLKPGDPDEPFIQALVDENNLDYFWVHSDLKDAFVRGYRLGYQDRTADLVLGPNITAAAALIGKKTGEGFVGVINAFEDGWAIKLKRAIDVFITLISEGSQSDREKFIGKFIEVYKVKHDETRKMLMQGGHMVQRAEGGTLLFIDYSKGKTLGALDIPEPETLKTEIYHQAFKVMGDELGRRYSTNLIKRDELVELTRRSKTALNEVEPYLAGNLGILKSSFIDSYGTDADNVFDGIIKDAGYTVKPVMSVRMPSVDESDVEVIAPGSDDVEVLPKKTSSSNSKGKQKSR